jgi:hypothetical protein
MYAREAQFDQDDWVRRRGAQSLRLMVNSSNETAIGAGQRLGFQDTAGTQPGPNDAALVEHELVISLERMPTTNRAG